MGKEGRLIYLPFAVQFHCEAGLPVRLRDVCIITEVSSLARKHCLCLLVKNAHAASFPDAYREPSVKKNIINK